MKELDRIKQEVANEQYGQSWEEACSWEHNMWPVVCVRCAQLIAENALKEAARTVICDEVLMSPTWRQIKSSITDPKNVKLI